MSKNKGGSTAFAALQNVGKTFMLPIALLPVAGLLAFLPPETGRHQSILESHTNI